MKSKEGITQYSKVGIQILINIARVLLALTFIFSGFVKAVDPIGTQYKLQDYAEALGLQQYVPDWLALSASVALSAMEFALGMFLLFAMMRRFVTRVTFAFMLVMTLVTVWLWLADPISDCGCFGDAIQLSNGETLLKNIVLLIFAGIVMKWPMKMPRFVTLDNQWLVFHYTFLFILATSVWSLYNLPVFDFRPYHLGVNIPKGMEMPEGVKGPEFETTFIMEKDGTQKEFTLEEYPDSTWTFVDSKTKQISEGYVPPIHDFSISDMETGDDLTDIINKGYVFLLISPHLEQADDSNFGNIDIIYEYAVENKYKFCCLTASGDSAITRWKDITGAEYPFYNTDETTLKTIIRSNPGLLLLKDGTIIGKWSHNFLPADEMIKQPLEKSEFGHMPEDETGKRILFILLWFVLPLALLTIADRLWMWSRWLKSKELKESDRIYKFIKNKTKNEKENRSR